MKAPKAPKANPLERPHRVHGGHDAGQHVLYQDFIFLSSNMLTYYAASTMTLCCSGKVLPVLHLHAEQVLLILLLLVVLVVEALSFATMKD